jgi:hypothetical protein
VTHRPGYQIGDQLFLYSVHDRVCPARFRVTAEPVYDPKRINREGRRGDGRRWGWLTEVKLLAAVDLDRAPTLIELGVEPLSMRHRDHKTFTADGYHRATAFIPDGVGGGERRSARPVPIEQGVADEFEQRVEAQTRSAQREEQRLVQAYARSLSDHGRRVSRHLLHPLDGSGPLVTTSSNMTAGTSSRRRRASRGEPSVWRSDSSRTTPA